MKTLRLAALVAVLLAAGAAQAVDTPTPANPVPSLDDRMASARKAIDAKDWQRAITELRAVLNRSPRDADAHNLLAYSYRKQSKPNLQLAFDHYKRALDINPRHLGAHEYIGEAYLMDGKPAEAEKHLAELEKLCGNKTCEPYADLAKSIADYKAKK